MTRCCSSPKEEVVDSCAHILAYPCDMPEVSYRGYLSLYQYIDAMSPTEHVESLLPALINI